MDLIPSFSFLNISNIRILKFLSNCSIKLISYGVNSDFVIDSVDGLFSHYMFAFGILSGGVLFCFLSSLEAQRRPANPNIKHGACSCFPPHTKCAESPFFPQKLFLLLGYHFLLLDLEPSRPAASALFTVSCFWSIQTFILY